MIDIIQISSAVYILMVFTFMLCGVIYHVWTGKSWDAHINGFPGLALVVATIVCAVTTLAGVS